MGFTKGPVSLSRFHVLPSNELPGISELCRLHASYQGAFVPRDGAAEEEILAWAIPENGSADQEVEAVRAGANGALGRFSLSDGQVHDGFQLRLRIERRAVSASYFQLAFREKVFRENRESGHAMSRSDRMALRDKMQRDMRKKALPAVSYVEGFWRPPVGLLYIFATSTKRCTQFLDLFQRSFAGPLNLTVRPFDPASVLMADARHDEASWAGMVAATTPLAFPELSA